MKETTVQVGDKKYKYKDVFKSNKANSEVTEDEREKMKNFLENW